MEAAQLKRIGDAGPFDEIAPAFDFGRQEFFQLGGRRTLHRNGAELDHQRLHLRRGRGLIELGVEPLDDRLRRRRRCADQGPADRVEAGTPASSIVGTSGSAGTRIVEDTPSGRTVPALICPITLPASANISAT